MCYDKRMKIIRTLQITEDEFYDYLEKSFLAVANKNRMPDNLYTVEDIKKGFTLTLGQSKSFPETLKIVAYTRGKCYATESKTVNDTIHFEYRTVPTDEGLEVTFEQKMPAYEKQKSNRFFRGFSDSIYLSRMSNSLYDIQNDILKHRDGVVDTGNKMQESMRKINEKRTQTVIHMANKLLKNEDA